MIALYIPDGKDTTGVAEAMSFAANMAFTMLHKKEDQIKALQHELQTVKEQYLKLSKHTVKIEALAEARRELNCSMIQPPESDTYEYRRYERAHKEYIEALDAMEEGAERA